MSETPDGLHRNQYAAHLLEEVLGWPSKGNLELMADCLLSISKSRKISIKQAHGYMERAIKLAKEQCVEVDRLFFMNGIYTTMRPAKKDWEETYQPISKEERETAQAWRKTPEFQEFVKSWSERINKAFGATAGK
jgi:hypothetical protein